MWIFTVYTVGICYIVVTQQRPQINDMTNRDVGLFYEIAKPCCQCDVIKLTQADLTLDTHLGERCFKISDILLDGLAFVYHKGNSISECRNTLK